MNGINAPLDTPPGGPNPNSSLDDDDDDMSLEEMQALLKNKKADLTDTFQIEGDEVVGNLDKYTAGDFDLSREIQSGNAVGLKVVDRSLPENSDLPPDSVMPMEEGDNIADAIGLWMRNQNNVIAIGGSPLGNKVESAKKKGKPCVINIAWPVLS